MMSKQDHYSVVRVVERCVRRARLTMDGAPIAIKDSESTVFFLTSWGTLLSDLLPQADALRSFLGFIGGQEIDLIRLSTSLDAFKGLILAQSDLETHETWRVTLQRFKRAEGAKHYYGALTPINPLLEKLFDDFSASNLSPVYQWLTFIEKANLRGLDLSVSLERDYIQAELEMQDWVYQDSLIDELASILTDWTQGFDKCVEEAFFPSFGPGAVAEKTPSRHLGVAGKYTLLSSDTRLEYMLSRLPSQVRVEASGRLNRTNKIVFVPKSLRKNRVISKEPASLGLYQHAVFACLDLMIRSNTYLRDRMDLHDQIPQQKAAWFGSLSGESATVDLSAASDSVTYTLVKRVFKHSSLRRMLICTRSDHAMLPSGNVVRLNKFAPMGSAVCFPIETLVFGAVCELACRRTVGVGSKVHNFGVYGDDITIDTRAVPELLSLLDALHMRVNTDKSFWNTTGLCFRESCGEFFARGKSVTPIRISRGLFIPREWNGRVRNVSTPGPRLALTALANECWMHGYVQTRCCVLYFLEKGYPRFNGIAFASPDYLGNERLITDYDSVTNYNLARRSNAPKGVPPYLDESAYHIWNSYVRPDTDQLRSLGTENYEKFSMLHWWRKRERALELSARMDRPLFREEFGVEIIPERESTWPYQTRESLRWFPLD